MADSASHLQQKLVIGGKYRGDSQAVHILALCAPVFEYSKAQMYAQAFLLNVSPQQGLMAFQPFQPTTVPAMSGCHQD